MINIVRAALKHSAVHEDRNNEINLYQYLLST